MSSGQIYQDKALARMKKPEKSGQLFSITSGIGWLALAAVAISIFSILVWAVFGVMADKVSGYGILLENNGVANIAPISSGRVLSMNVKIGDHVSKDDVVAVLDQSELEQQMFLQADQAHDAGSHVDMRSRAAKLAEAKEEYQREAYVKSPYSGIITGQRLREGDIVQAGTALYDVRPESGSEDLMAVIYVSALTGDKIKQGMTIQISPGAIDSSLYGSLVGTVMSVSEYPVTSERIVYWTGNKEFANWVVQSCGGAIMEVRVALTRDEGTPSGYLWTTILGSEEKIKSGMTCTSTAIVKRQAPLVKAFDKLSQWIRSD